MLSHWRGRWTWTCFDTLGNVPADLMNASYLMLKPFRLNVQKYVACCSTSTMTRRRWRTSCAWRSGSSIADLAGEAFPISSSISTRQWPDEGHVRIGEEAVDLSQVTLPC